MSLEHPLKRPAVRRSQRGAALLTAMVIVTLIATLAAGMVWQQWRAVQVEAAERARAQGQWVLAGAIDWARLILREDAKADQQKGGAATDNLGEPWAVPLAESNLSTFLAADKSDAEAAPDAFLSGSIVDAASFYNLQNLMISNASDPADRLKKEAEARNVLERIGRLAGTSPGSVDLIVNGMRQALAGELGSGTTTPSDAPLTPSTLDELAWFGVSKADIEKLRPYVTLAQGRPSFVNLNTASKEVISAVANIDLATADRVVQLRTKQPFGSLGDASKQLGTTNTFSAAAFDVKTYYFFVRGRLRLEDRVVEEQALMHRVNTTVTVVSRQRLNALDAASATPSGG